MSQYILIAGDSWGCGEWSGLPMHQLKKQQLPVINHLGLEQFISENTSHRVHNLSVGGHNNSVQVKRICEVTQTDNIDKIIWFQTDPLRDCKNLQSPKEFWDDKQTLKEFVQCQKTYLESSYHSLNQLGIPVYCIGGCFPLDLQLISNYSNLIPLIPSLVSFLCPQESSLPISSLCISWTTTHVPTVDCQLVDFLTYEFKLLDDWLLLCNNQLTSAFKYFVPDCKHPNRLGHEQIFNLLIDQQII